MRHEQDVGEASLMSIPCACAVCIGNIVLCFRHVCMHYCTEQFDPQLLTNGTLEVLPKTKDV